MAVNWTDAETFLFIEQWVEQILQEVTVWLFFWLLSIRSHVPFTLHFAVITIKYLPNTILNKYNKCVPKQYSICSAK